MDKNKELRFNINEFRAEELDKNKLIGYASVFDQATQLGQGLYEVVRRGAFKRAIEEKHDVRALIDHNPSLVLGRSKSNTLKMEEDNIGLRVEIDLPDSQVAKDIKESVRRGDVDQMSFGFIIKQDRFTRNNEGVLREVLDVDLFDVSIVTYPAYEGTSISLRSAEEGLKDFLEKEKLSQQKLQKFELANDLHKLKLLELAS